MRPPSADTRWVSAAELALGLLAARWIPGLLPLDAEDPFRTSLVILPLALAALRALERHAPRGKRATRRAASPVEGVALGGLLLLTLGRRSLGLAATDWFLAGGYLLLLAHRVARLLLLWRGALGRSVPERPHAAFFFLPFLVYLILQPWQAEHRQVDGDEPFYLLLAHSLAHDFDADLGNNYARKDWRAFMDRPIEPQPGDPRGANGEVYSRHNVLLPLVLAPAYLLAGRWGAMALMAAFAAALAWMVLRLARGAAPGAALMAYVVFAFGPPLILYSYQIWIEVPAALVVVLALDRIRSTSCGSRRHHAVVLALLLVLLPLLKLRLGLVALPLAILAVYRIRPSRRTLLVLTGTLAVALGGLLAHNQVLYGNLLKVHSWSELNLSSSSLGDFARGAFGMFFDVAFGLFPAAPIWLLLLPAGWLLVRPREGGREGDSRLIRPGELAVVTLPYLVTLAPRFEWYGGWSPPFRYPIVFLPLFALALVPLFELHRQPRVRALVAGLGALTLLIALISVVVPGWTYNFADGRTHLLDEAGARIGADLARFFPSTVRPRLATWVWPFLSLLLIPLALRGGPTNGPRRSGSAALAGFVTLLLAATALPLLARHWPTRTIEVEDAWVSKEKGVQFPDAWVLQRPRYRGGWVIPPRGRIEARLAPGGGQVRLRLSVRVVNPDRPARLLVDRGETTLAAIDVPAGDWHDIELGPFAWSAGQSLVLRGAGPGWPGRAAVDRVECTWE